MVPNGWEICSVDDICHSVSVGIVIKPSQYYTSESLGIKAFRSANVREGFINNSDWVYLSQAGHAANKKSQLTCGDVLIVRTGYPGTACVVTKGFENTNAIDIVIAKPNKRKILPEYLCAFTNSEFGKGQVVSLQGGMAQKHLNVGAYQELKVKLPPIKEQSKIASILTTWDRAIATCEALLANSQIQKKALMQQLLTGKHWHPGSSHYWEEGVLINHCTVGTGAKDLQDKMDDGLYPFYVRSQSIERINTYSFDGEAILIPGDGRVGEIFHYTNGKFDFHQRVYKISNFKGIDGKFLYFYLCHFFKREAIKNTAKATVDSLRMPVFTKMTIRTPPLEEQKAIAAILTAADREITLCQQQLAHLKQEKQALMQQLLTGKRRVKVNEEGTGC